MQRQDSDPYEVLGLAQGATHSEIRAAYLRLARKHHPDKNPGDKTSEWIFKEVGRAYEKLQGAEYDHPVRSQPSRSARDQDVGARGERRGQGQQTRDWTERERRERAKRDRPRREQHERWERADAGWASTQEPAQSKNATRSPERNQAELPSHSSFPWLAGIVIALFVGVFRIACSIAL